MFEELLARTYQADRERHLAERALKEFALAAQRLERAQARHERMRLRLGGITLPQGT